MKKATGECRKQISGCGFYSLSCIPQSLILDQVCYRSSARKARRVWGFRRARWSMRTPATQRSRSSLKSRGIRLRWAVGILQSMKRSFTFFSPSIPNGWKRSPGRKERRVRGKSRASQSSSATVEEFSNRTRGGWACISNRMDRPISGISTYPGPGTVCSKGMASSLDLEKVRA